MRIFCFLTLLILALSIESHEIKTEISSEKEEPVWQDLKIQTLLPEYIVFPAIEPYLPPNFVALQHPKNLGIYWGPKEVLEDFFTSKKGPKSPIIYVEISTSVAQKDSDSFVDEDKIKQDLIYDGAKKIKLKKWNWGINPVLSFNGLYKDTEMNIAWIGLDHEGMTLMVALITPKEEKTLSPEAHDLWTNFLTKTRPLEEQEFFKSNGQDLREGLTLVNLNGSILKCYAEKRTRDNEIQIVIKPFHEDISCKCLNITQAPMPLTWHHDEPLIKIEAELRTTGKANIIQHNYINILLKSVIEFSLKNDEASKIYIAPEKIKGFSILNFTKEKSSQDTEIQKAISDP